MIINHISYYLGHHKDKNVVFFLGMNSDSSNLVTTLKTNKFENIFVVFEDYINEEKFKKDILEEIGEQIFQDIKFIEKNDIQKEVNKYDIVFAFDYYANCGEMIEFAKLSPKKTIGLFGPGFNTFRIWEHFRKYCEEISLARVVNDFRNEVLEWKKNPETDIELSVVFPMYKVEQYLPKCLESVTKWNAPYVEFLFVDDGSPDNSKEVIKQYAKKDNRIKLLIKENGGCASARQFGIDHSKGRYIGLIDPDDFIDPTMFEKLLSRALIGTYDIAYSGYYEFYEESQTFKAIDDVTGFPYTLGTSDTKLIDDLIAYRRIAIWRGIYSRELLEQNNIKFHTDLKRFDDLPFKVETMARAKSVVSVDEPLYYYRMGRPGQDVSANDERLYVHFDIFKYLDEFFKKYRSSEQLKHYYQVKVQTHFWAIGLIKKELRKEYLQKASKDLNIKNNKRSWKKVVSKYYKKQEIKQFLKLIK